MKKTIRSLILTMFVVASMFVYGNDKDASSEEKNVIKNSNFEKLTGKKTAVGWFRYNNMRLKATADCYMTIDTETFKALPIGGGFNAVKIVKKGGVVSMLAQNNIAVEGGASYMFSMEHKETPGYSRNIYVCIAQKDVKKKNITGKKYYFATNVQPSLEWKKFSKKLTVKPDTAILELYISPNGNGTCWIKNVKLIKIENKGK